MPFLFQLALAPNRLNQSQQKEILVKEAADAKPMPAIPGDSVTGRTYVLSNSESASLIVGSPEVSIGLPDSRYVIMYRKREREPDALNFNFSEDGKLIGIQAVSFKFSSIEYREIQTTPESLDKLNSALVEMRDQTKRRESIATITKGEPATLIAMPSYIMTIMSPEYPENSTGHYLIMLNPQEDKTSNYVSKHAFIDPIGGFVRGEVKKSEDDLPSRMDQTSGLADLDAALDEVVKAQDELKTEKRTLTLPTRPVQKMQSPRKLI